MNYLVPCSLNLSGKKIKKGKETICSVVNVFDRFVPCNVDGIVGGGGGEKTKIQP